MRERERNIIQEFCVSFRFWFGFLGCIFRPSLEVALILSSLHYFGPNSVVLLHLTVREAKV